MSHLIGQGRGQLPELPDHLATLRGLTKWADRIAHPTDAAHTMEQAFQHMLSGKHRPVGVEAPWDVFGQAAEVSKPKPARTIKAPVPDPADIESEAALIKKAKNPLIMVGAGGYRVVGEWPGWRGCYRRSPLHIVPVRGFYQTTTLWHCCHRLPGITGRIAIC